MRQTPTRPRRIELSRPASPPPDALQRRLIEGQSLASNIGPFLRIVREELARRFPDRFGVRAVARLLDVAPASVSRYERDERRVPFAYIVAFARLIGTSVDGLIRLANSPEELAQFTPAPAPAQVQS